MGVGRSDLDEVLDRHRSVVDRCASHMDGSARCAREVRSDGEILRRGADVRSIGSMRLAIG